FVLFNIQSLLIHILSQYFLLLKCIKYSRSPFGNLFLSNFFLQNSQYFNGVSFFFLPIMSLLCRDYALINRTSFARVSNLLTYASAPCLTVGKLKVYGVPFCCYGVALRGRLSYGDAVTVL